MSNVELYFKSFRPVVIGMLFALIARAAQTVFTVPSAGNIMGPTIMLALACWDYRRVLEMQRRVELVAARIHNRRMMYSERVDFEHERRVVRQQLR